MASNNVKLSTYLANEITWERVTGKPAYTTRWPAWSEVTDKPATATRWPTFAEVTDKPADYPGGCTGNAATATTASYLSPPEASAYTTDTAGNFTHKRTTTSDYWHLNKNAGGVVFSVYWETGNVTAAGTITAAGFVGNVTGNCSGSAGSVAWSNVTGKPSTFPPSTHTHDYLPFELVSSLDANSANTSTKFWVCAASITNAAFTNHSVLLNVAGLGTPFQLQIPDSSHLYIYKRWYASSAWSAWSKISAGYADSAGSVAWDNVTGKPSTFAPASHTHSYLPLSGGTLTGAVTFANNTMNTMGDDCKIGDQNVAGALCIQGANGATNIRFIQYSGTAAGSITWDGSKFSVSSNLFVASCLDIRGATNATMSNATTNPRIRFSESGSQAVYLAYTDYDSYRASKGLKVVDADGSDAGNVWFEAQGHIYAAAVHSAVWNDYAECRKSNISDPGRVIAPDNSGMSFETTERLMAGCRVISDTWGMLIGESEEAKTPVAICGRVLAYPYQAIGNYHIGDCVCSAPNGTVDIMTRDEIKEWPDRIIGVVNEIPDYEIWTQTEPDGEKRTKQIVVNGRIWIDVR